MTGMGLIAIRFTNDEERGKAIAHATSGAPFGTAGNRSAE